MLWKYNKSIYGKITISQMKNSFFILFVLYYFPLSAQIQFNSFQEVLNFADANAISIKSALIGEQISIAEKKETKSYLFPSINTSLGYNDNITIQPTLVPAQFFNPEAPDDAFEEMTFGTRYNYSGGIQAQWDILDFQKIFAVQTANLKLNSSKINTEISRYNTYNQIASTYYSIILTQESIQIYEENLRVATTIYEQAEDKYEKGIISEAELNQAEIKKLQNKRTLYQSKNNLSQFYLNLQTQLNTNEAILITDTPENFKLKNTAIQTIHPEIRWQEAELKRYESIFKQTKASRFPTVSLNYQYNQIRAMDEIFGFSDANTLPQQSFGIQVNLSGLTRNSTKQKIKQSKWQLELQQQQLENTMLVKQKEDQLLQLDLEQQGDLLIENEAILSLQQKNDIHSQNQYLGGIISLDQRLDKYDDLLAAQDNYLQSLAGYTLAQYKIYIRQINFQPKSIK